MSKIQLLPEKLRNQIAAGEVVERPSSVVKELVENSIDAGAKNIEVILEESGIKKIQVRDDGEGMTEEDAEISIQAHATSKLKTAEDLFAISSLGFRGEALASIASVSYFKVETKQESSQVGTSVEVHLGHKTETQSCACKNGTTITVEELFENVPARRKFLKTANTELKHSVGILEDIALCHPETAFLLKHNNKEIFRLFSGNLEDRVKALLSEDVFLKLIPVEYSLGTTRIFGFVSKPGEIFKTRNNQKIFVNHRAVQDKTVAGAVLAAFHSFLEKGAYPAYYLFVELPADKVDVNVHPRKSEVRFLQGQEVFQAVKNALLAAFEKKHVEFQGGSTMSNEQLGMNNEMQNVSSSSVSVSRTFGTGNPVKFSSTIPSVSYSSPPDKGDLGGFTQMKNTFSETKSNRIPAFAGMKNESELSLDHAYDELDGYKIVGQAANKFLILEKDERVIFLDQHAVHERARYDTFMKKWKEKKPESQTLLLSEIVNCSAQEFLSIQEHLDFLEQVGFSIEEFGTNTFQVTALPIGIKNENLKEILIKTCDELGESGEQNALDEGVEKALTYLSCRGSIMFGDALTIFEQKALVKDWLAFAKGLTCPHGRPLGFEMSVKELEKKVGR